MSRSLLPENDSNNIVNYSEKRNRKPSKFAEGINELKRQTVTKNLRKEKNLHYNDIESQQSRIQQPDDPNALFCILPTGKKLKLSIIIKKPIKKVVNKLPTPVPKPIQKQESKATLLDAFLIAFDKLKTAKVPLPSLTLQQNGKSNDQQNNQGENEKNRKKQLKVRKQKEEEDKYERLVEKYKTLNEKLIKKQEQMIFI